ncbi:MAG: hypothetical protein AB8B96_05360 [Lysobacterales bacterium]
MEPRVESLASATPQQEKPGRNSRFASRKAFDEWLASLPLANVTAAGNELLAGVQDLNHSKVSARFRLHALEQVTEPCLAVVNVLDKQYHDAVFPLTDKTDKVGRTVVHFFRELAMGYRLAAHQFANESARFSLVGKRAGGLAIHRALSCCEQLVFRCGQLFRAPPTGIWSEIHILYAFAAQNGMESRTIVDTLGWSKKSHRIEDIYKRTALLGLCDPQRLSQRAITQVHKACEMWRDKTTLATGKAAVGQFAITIDDDCAPMLVLDDESPSGDFRFDLSSLKQWLQKLLSSENGSSRDIPLKSAGHETLILDGMLLRQLTATWGERIERRHKRLPATHKARVVIGLNGIHFMAAGEQSFGQFLEETGNEKLTQQAGSINNWVAGSDQRFRPPQHEAEILNQSLGGYRLRFVKPQNMQIRVGELITLSTAAISERDAIWMVAAVKWLQSPDPEEVEVGLSVVGQDVKAAAVLADLPGRRIPPARALLTRGFAANDANNQYLLVPPFHSETKVPWLTCWREEMQFHETMLQVDGLADRTTEYCRYTYAIKPSRIDGVPDLGPVPMESSGIPPLDVS